MKIAWDRDYSVSQAKRDYERLGVNDMEVTPSFRTVDGMNSAAC